VANEEHLNIINEGVESWNHWRQEQPGFRSVRPDLSEADLSGRDLSGIQLEDAILNHCNLSDTNLTSAFLIYSELIGSNLNNATLVNATLQSSRLISTNLTNANLRGADLRAATLLEADLTNADLTGCYVYGISAWKSALSNTRQSNLIITPENEPLITVDDLEVAQFVYLLLNNARIRDVISTITSKVVLILGSFRDRRKVVLDALRAELRNRNYSPILFDFEKPANRDITETISTLAHLARFIIADITEAKSIPQELERIIPDLPSVPVQPLLHVADREYGMFEHFTRYPWVLPVCRYTDEASLLLSLQTSVIGPAEDKVIQLQGGS
jgi:uncharacterized protein YjbI with pentapeptide repeats